MSIKTFLRATTLLVCVAAGLYGSKLWATTHTVGPNAPHTAVSCGPPTCGGGAVWSNPDNIFAADGHPATVSMGPIRVAPLNSQFLVATGFGFNIPAGAVIQGISVAILRAGICTPAGSDSIVKDVNVLAVKGGVTAGANHAHPGVWPCGDLPFYYAYYGSSTDLWGTTWTPAAINSPNFGVALEISSTDNTTEAGGAVDFISVTVTYTQ